MSTDEMCYGYHVWSDHPVAPECLRCGFVDLAPPTPRPSDPSSGGAS